MAEGKARSLYALDALNFCNAGIQTGLGPFIAIFYTAVRHWNPGEIGVLIACQSGAGIAMQPFVGGFVDESHHKRFWTALSGTIVAAACLGVVLFPQYWEQLIMQMIIGVAVTVFPAASSAFALGMVSRDAMSRRIARNETLTHTGNVIFAIAAGAVGTLLALQGVFVAAAVFAAGMAPAAMFISTEHVNYEAARAGADPGQKGDAPGRKNWKELLTDRNVLTFTISVVLFYFANAATLPLVSEILTQGKHGRQSAWQVAAAVVVAEAVMVGVAAASGKLADKWGRKPLFLVGFAALALRNVLTVVSHNQYYLISLQALDGVAMAIYGVLLTVITADLAKGTGRFNLLQGAVQSSMGLGGVLSNSLFGWIAKAVSFNSAFWGLSGVAIVGGLFFLTRMPETRETPRAPNPEPKARAAAAAAG